MKEYALAVLPFNDFSPEACKALAVAIEDVITVLENWNIRVNADSRLRVAQRHLAKVADAGSYGKTEKELIQIAKAASLAKDFYEISNALRKDRDDPIAEELKLAIRGTLDGKSQNKSPYAFLSQYWVGMLFAHGGLKPAVLAQSAGAKPDFVVAVGTLDLVVEVKRPHSVKSALRCLEAAADQLRDSIMPGVICLDLSECIVTDDLIIPRDGMWARKAIDEKMSSAQEELIHHINSYNRSDKFSRVIDLVLFAKYWVWKSLDPPENDVGFTFRITPFPDACQGLLWDEIKIFQEKVSNGMNKLSEAVAYTLKW